MDSAYERNAGELLMFGAFMDVEISRSDHKELVINNFLFFASNNALNA